MGHEAGYAVIFTAKVKAFDDTYSAMAQQMRDKAMSEYGCTAFNAVTEGDDEIAVSYWPDIEAIKHWKADLEHITAQQLGRERWYQWYQVDVVKIERSYSVET